MVNKYKNEVGSLALSDSFKADLKAKMAKELSNEATKVITIKPWIKYSKYIASAACLALILATMGIVSLFGNGLKVEKALEDANMMYDMYDTADVTESATGDGDATESDYGIANGVSEADTEENDDALAESDDDSIDNLESAVEEEEPIVEEDVSIDAEEEVITEESPAVSTAPEGYDGEYHAEDYVLGNNGNPEYTAEMVSTDVQIGATLLKASNDIPASEEEEIIPEEDEDIEAGSEEEVPEEDILESIPYVQSDMTYSDLCLTVLDDMSVNFVKFKVEKVYTPEEAVDLTGDEGYKEYKTLYKVNITNDYIAGESVDYTINLSADGTIDNQLLGRPVMVEGDVFASMIVYENGVGEMLDQLIYQIHRLNGVDIAYHLGYENLNPGDTNMGILSFEQEVITSTLNNPAMYTHKASLKELYRYLRRNWNRQEFELTNLEETFGSAKPEQSGTPVEKLKKTVKDVEILIGDEILDISGNGEVIGENYSSLISGRSNSSTTASIMFMGARISFNAPTEFSGPIKEISLSNGCVLPITVNGVTVGSSLDDLVSAFKISSYVDNVLSFRVISTDTNGNSFEVLFKVNENVVTEITIK